MITSPRVRTLSSAVAALLLFSAAAGAAENAELDAAAVVSAFHAALKGNNPAAVMALLAPDAQILESGHSETRAEYEKGHLAADMEFAQAVESTREKVTTRQEGEVTWVTSTSHSTGSFKGREVNSAGAELMVLSKTPDGWHIRAIHWSSHALKKP